MTTKSRIVKKGIKENKEGKYFEIDIIIDIYRMKSS